MPQKFLTLLTQAGAADLVNAQVYGLHVPITHLCVGDAFDAPMIPNEAMTALKREVFRTPITSLSTDPENPNWLVIEAVIPANVGGWTIHEIGLIGGLNTDNLLETPTNPGQRLLAVGNFMPTYKSLLSEGAASDLSIRMIVQVANAAIVTLTIDPSVVVATQKNVEQAIQTHRQEPHPHDGRYAPLAHLTDPAAHTDIREKLESAVKAATAATASADGAAGTAIYAKSSDKTSLNKAATPAGVAAQVAALVNSSPAALDTLAELAAALGGDANFAATMTAALAGKAPTTRKINTTAPLKGGGDLQADRTLTIDAATAATASADGAAGTAIYAKDTDRTSRNKAATPAGVASLTREIKTANVNIYVRTDGNDANNGLANTADGAVKTWTGVFAVLEKLDVRRFKPNINFGPGEFAGVSFMGSLTPGGPTLNTFVDVVCDTAGGTIFTSNITITFSEYIRFQNPTFKGTFCAQYGSHAMLVNPTFLGAATAINALYSNYNSVIIVSTGAKFSGAFTNGLIACRDSTINAEVPITFEEGTTFSSAFAQAEDSNGYGSSINLQAATFTGSFTGKKYLANHGGVFINRTPALLNSQIPGTINGTYNTGDTMIGGKVDVGDLLVSGYQVWHKGNWNGTFTYCTYCAYCSYCDCNCNCCGGSCFVAGTKVQTPDGLKPIERIFVGNTVLGGDGQPTDVIFIFRPKVGVRRIWSVNHGAFLCTGDHLFLLSDGTYGAIEPERYAADKARRIVSSSAGRARIGFVDPDAVKGITVGSRLAAPDGEIIIEHLDAAPRPAQETVYQIFTAAGNYRIEGGYISEGQAEPLMERNEP